MRKFWILLAIIFASICSHGQRQNTFYVTDFPGKTVQQKKANAEAQCNPNTAMPCYIVIDPTLATWQNGTTVADCAQCVVQDYRSGAQTGSLTSAQVIADIAGNAIAPASVASNTTQSGGTSNPTIGTRFSGHQQAIPRGVATGFDYSLGVYNNLLTCTLSSGSSCLPASSSSPTSLAKSVLGARTVALIVDGTSIDRGYNSGDPWGPTNTANSGVAGNDIQGGAGYNPQTTTALMGTSTWVYKVTQLPALKSKITWVQNISSDGSWASNIATSSAQARFGTVTSLCSQAGVNYDMVIYALDQGSNDLYGYYLISYNNPSTQQDQTAANTYTVLDNLWKAAKTAGCTVVAFTAAPRTDLDTGAQAQLLILNNGVRESMDYDILVDAAKLATNAAGGAGETVDGTHWTGAFHTAVARAVNAALISGGMPGAVN